MTDAELAALRALADAATPGPWEVERAIDNPKETIIKAPFGGVKSGEIARLGFPNHPQVRADAAFIAAAREAVLALLAEVERLREAHGMCETHNKQLQWQLEKSAAEVERLRTGNAQLQQQRHAAREDGYQLGVTTGLDMARDIRDERDRLREELAQAQHERNAYRVELSGMCKALADSSLLPTGFIAAELRAERIEALYGAFGADESKWPESALARLADLREKQAAHEARYT